MRMDKIIKKGGVESRNFMVPVVSRYCTLLYFNYNEVFLGNRSTGYHAKGATLSAIDQVFDCRIVYDAMNEVGSQGLITFNSCSYF